MALLGSLIITTAFGLVQANLDLHKFQFHKYSAYLTIGLATIHVVLNWPSLRKWLTERGIRRRRMDGKPLIYNPKAGAPSELDQPKAGGTHAGERPRQSEAGAASVSPSPGHISEVAD